MHKVMIDLETMGTAADAAIVAIGAVMFDETIGDSFYAVVDLSSSMEEGGTVSGNTVTWWLKQSEEARRALTDDSYRIGDALNNLWNWLNRQCPIEQLEVWGNGAAFDNVILGSAYDRHKSFKGRPWRFYNDRCYRTVKAMYPDVPVERVGTAHNALDDAITQAYHLIKITKGK